MEKQMKNTGNDKTISKGDYFIADIAFVPSNPVHRVIAVCDGDESGQYTFSLFSDGYESIRSDVDPQMDLHYFSLVKKIDGMERNKDIRLASQKMVSFDFE